MVSILIRSMDRAFLTQALDSVALQTYSNIEVVVIAVRPEHRSLPSHCGPFPMRLVETDAMVPRSAAANRAMAHAQGEFLIFLDDDDWMMPGHIDRLAQVLGKHGQAFAAYTGIGLVDADGKSLGQAFDLPFDAVRQMAGNLTPIHAVLFKATVLANGCHFDETLDRLEDWDFWLQIGKLAPMVHLPGISAVYRIHESSGVHNDAGIAGAATGRIYQKWEESWSPQQISQIMQRVWMYPDLEALLNATQEKVALLEHIRAGMQTTIAEQATSIAEQSSFIADQASCITEQSQSIDQLQELGESLSKQLIKTTTDLERSEGVRLAVLNSRFWRMTQPLRMLATQVKAIRSSSLWDPWDALKQFRLSKSIGRFFHLCNVFFTEGSHGLQREWAPEPVAAPTPGQLYRAWTQTHDVLSDNALASLGATAAKWDHHPLISIVMPVYNPPVDLLDAAVTSVKNQIYPHWELCIADDASSNEEVWLLLQRLALSDKRIKIVRRETNGHISHASNSALELATGEFMALMDNDDILPRDALYWVAEATIRVPDVQIIYSDEDKLDAKGERYEPYLKSDWNYTLFLGHNLISHLGVYRLQLVRELGGFRVGLEGSQDYDLALRCIEKIAPTQIVHIPRVLYHWRAIESSTALNIESKPYALDAGQAALQDHLVRIGSKAVAQRLPSLNYRCVRPDLAVGEALTIVLVRPEGEPPSKDQPEWLRLADFYNAEVLNCTDNAAALNACIAAAKGTLVALIRSDISPRDPSALSELIGYAQEEKTGAVAGTVRDTWGQLQCGGLILCQTNIASVLHKNLTLSSHGYMGRGFLAQELSALTMDCIVFRKDVFVAHGGFDADLGVSPEGAVAWCLRLREQGYRMIWCPQASWVSSTATKPHSPTQVELRRQFFMNRYGNQYANWLLRDPAYHPAFEANNGDFALPN